MIVVQDLFLQAGQFRLQRVSLRISAGQYMVLMGPTGSGKSLLLKCICGLVRPHGGSVWVDHRDVTDLAPRLRGVGYVPQDGGLFPHMNVARNITFSLRARGTRHQAALGQAGELVEALNLQPLLNRSVSSLSGGERQKVALARALVPQPKVLLLDEPVSALDEPTRAQACQEIRRIQRLRNVTTIHVCHSAAETRMVADLVGVLHLGRLEQLATLQEMLARPASAAVMGLLNGGNGTGVPHPA